MEVSLCQLLTKKMVLACCVLPNMCEELGDQHCEDVLVMHVNIEPSVHVLKNINSREELMRELHW